MKLKSNILVACVFVLTNALADISVSDVKVFSGYPWKEVVVGYTIMGTPAETDFDIIELSATDKSANKTYTTRSLTGAVLTEGRHVLRWNAATEGVKFSSENVVFSVSIVRQGVQLWANGPYWAECNVGATKPEEYGYYFCWGDTVGYKRNASNDGWVSVADGKVFSFSRSNCPTPGSVIGVVDLGYTESAILVAKYDAATKHLGSRWRMPTITEWDALISNCTITWMKYNGVYGQLVTGKGNYATKSIFLPAAGYGSLSALKNPGSEGYYWSSSVNGISDYHAWGLYFISSDFYRSGSCMRYNGQPVRAIRGFAQ